MELWRIQVVTKEPGREHDVHYDAYHVVAVSLEEALSKVRAHLKAHPPLLAWRFHMASRDCGEESVII